MSLILCRQEPVKHLCHIDVLGIHIHSSQELCYIVYNHLVLVMDDLLDDLLIDFIRKDLDMDYLVGRMEKLVETGARPKEVLALFLSECDYYSDKEMQKSKQTMATLRVLRPAQYEKQRVDYMLVQRQYGKAAARYGKILEYPRDKAVEDLFLAKVYNNLGVCYVMMFQFHKALSCHDKAYELGKDDALLKHIYFFTVFAPGPDAKDRYQPVFTDERKRKWSEEIGLVALEVGQVEEARVLWALFKKDPTKRMSGAAEMVRRQKQEYRTVV